MKQVFLFAFLLLTTFHSLLAQQEVISRTTEFIVAKKYDAANLYLDSILRKNAKNADAMMMKGNVILNRATEKLKTINRITADDESIFYSTIQPKEAKILPADTVFAIEKFWRKSLNIDSSRNDIRKGLCTIYSMALMKEKLKQEITALTTHEKNEDGEQPYRITEYARKFKEREKFDDAMEMYQFIANLFPNVAGLRCDIASEYFYEGKMKEALIWLDSCYSFKTVDETSFLNGAFIYSELGYYDDAQNVLNTYSRIYQRKMDQFYFGLRLFADSSDEYFETLASFTQSADSNSYSTEIYMAQKLLAFRDSFRVNNYQQLTSDNSIPDYYKVLIHSRALKQFVNQCEPSWIYGLYQSSIENYSAAVQFLEEGESCDMNLEQKEYWMLHYAYVLNRIGDSYKALQYFSKLYGSKTLFTQQAAKYFSAKILFEFKKDVEAKRILEEVSSSNTTTKYVQLARQKLK